jgi:hypothetical protein
VTFLSDISAVAPPSPLFLSAGSRAETPVRIPKGYRDRVQREIPRDCGLNPVSECDGTGHNPESRRTRDVAAGGDRGGARRPWRGSPSKVVVQGSTDGFASSTEPLSVTCEYFEGFGDPAVAWPGFRSAWSRTDRAQCMSPRPRQDPVRLGRSLIRRGPFDVIHDEDWKLHLPRLQLEPKLLLHGGEYGRR